MCVFLKKALHASDYSVYVSFQSVHKADLVRTVWNNVCVKMALIAILKMENARVRRASLDSSVTEVNFSSSLLYFGFYR